MTDIDLAWAVDTSARVGMHFTPMRDPSRKPADREYNGKHVGWYAHRSHDYAAVVVDVRIKLALDEVGIAERDGLQAHRDVEQRIVDTELVEQAMTLLLDDLRARIEVLIDAMSEAHELNAFVPFLDAVDETLELLAAFHQVAEHFDDCDVGSAV